MRPEGVLRASPRRAQIRRRGGDGISERGEDNCCAVNRPNAAVPRVTKAAITPTTAFIAFSTHTTATLNMWFPGETAGR
jgi:hypothetical protein